MKEIPLNRGYVTLVDDEDFESLSVHKWYVQICRERTYAIRCMGRKTILMHQQILRFSVPNIDHVDRLGLNNQKSNLRPCNHAQNQGNRAVLPSNRSGRKGVTQRGNKFIARIKSNYGEVRLGTYSNVDEAAHAYNKAAIHVFGEFACLNPVGIDPRAKPLAWQRAFDVADGEAK